MDTFDHAGIIVYSIEAFAYLLHAALGNRLEAQEQLLTPARCRNFQKLVIVCSLNRGLAAPPLAVWSYRAKQLLRILLIRGDVVVPKDDCFSVERTILRRNLCHRPFAESVPVHPYNGAKIAAIGASPRSEQNTAREVLSVK